MSLLNRRRLRELVQTKLSDVNVLIKGKRYDGAYYVCGYVVECALKACIAKQTKRGDFPDKNTVDASYTHNLTRLVGIAGLQSKLDEDAAADKTFEQNWAIVKDWSENSRYQKHTRQETQALYEAIVDNGHGVLRWIKRYW